FAQGGAQGRVSLNESQRTRIHSVVVSKNLTSRFRVSNVSFAVRTGTVVPRSFHLFTVPSDIVTIAPRFRGFRFFIWEDEIVFVDPVTLESGAVTPGRRGKSRSRAKNRPRRETGGAFLWALAAMLGLNPEAAYGPAALRVCIATAPRPPPS